MSRERYPFFGRRVRYVFPSLLTVILKHPVTTNRDYHCSGGVVLIGDRHVWSAHADALPSREWQSAKRSRFARRDASTLLCLRGVRQHAPAGPLASRHAERRIRRGHARMDPPQRYPILPGGCSSSNQFSTRRWTGVGESGRIAVVGRKLAERTHRRCRTLTRAASGAKQVPLGTQP